MVDDNTKPVIDWLIDGARSARAPEQVLAELCNRLLAAGIPVWRVAVFVRTLHPNVMARRFIWRQGADVEVAAASYELANNVEYQRSPVVHVYQTGQAFRRRLIDPNTPNDFSFLDELRAEGVTDYLISPLIFTDGEIHAASWTTRHPDGFSEAQIADLEGVVKPLARVAEIRALRRTATNLLDTYVGTHTGERILAGQIRRGDVEAIHAAIWLSDMRGFTGLADRLPSRTLVDLLNWYFDCQVPAIIEGGGEVLKFIGDGLLAIFPVATDGSNADRVCGGVLDVASIVRGKIAALRDTIDIEGVDELRFGLALHLGEVLYGNIGGGNRLDFTCIGPAVNLAARLEKLTGPLGRTLLASDGFAQHCRARLTSVGEFALAGFTARQTAFGLADEGRAPASA